MINSRDVAELSPPARQVCLAHIAACKAAGIDIIVTSTYRDRESQDALFAIGRTADLQKPRVTKARGGQSWHNFRVAYDVVPVVNGKAVWDTQNPLWKEVIRIGKECGAEAGADWPGFPDFPHFQMLPTELKGKKDSVALPIADARFTKSGTIFEV